MPDSLIHGVNSVNRELARQRALKSEETVTMRTASSFVTIMDCRTCATGICSQEIDTHDSLQLAVDHVDFCMEDAGLGGTRYQWEFQNIAALDAKGKVICQWDLNEARWVLDAVRRARPKDAAMARIG